MQRKLILILIISINCFKVSAQKEVWNPEFHFDCLQEGTYKLKGYDEKYLNLDLPTIKPNIKILQQEKRAFFLNPKNEEIVLFANHDIEKLKPIAKLNKLTQVQVDSTFFKYKYKDYTNCVWNRIIIDNTPYYTDIDIHDFSINKKLNKLNQNISIIGQYDGYDGAYHLGYPEYIFLIFTNNENKVIHKTKVLEFYLNDEFAMEEDILKIGWNEKANLYSIVLIGADDKIQIDWNGKSADIIKL